MERGYSREAVLLSLCILGGCAPAVGAGAGVAMLGGAILTRGCYDSVDVVLVDAASGQRTCDAQVSAIQANGGKTEFLSCYHAALPLGKWTIRAERAGYRRATTELLVRKTSRGCEPAVQSVELAIHPVGHAPEAPMAVRPLRPGEAPISPASMTPPASMLPPSAIPGPAAPPATQAPVTSAPTEVAPAPSEAPTEPVPPAPAATSRTPAPPVAPPASAPPVPPPTPAPPVAPPAPAPPQ